MSLKDIVETVQSIATTVAILVGGIWAYRLFWLKRQKYPRVGIQHHILDTPLTQQKTVLNVTVDLSNDSDVLIELKSGEIWIQQVLPLPSNLTKAIDEGKDPVRLLREVISDEARVMWSTEVAWPLIAQYHLDFESWHKKEVEPGNQLQLRYDFVLDSDVKHVKIYSFYENAAKAPRTIARGFWKDWRTKKYVVGWECASFYDLDHRTKVI